MNNLGKSLLVASFAIGAANATGSTNKTFFSGRPVGVNLAMEGTTWHKQINTPTDLEDHFDSALQITGFYQENTNQDSLGKYFSFQNKDNLEIGAAGGTTEVDHRHLMHDPQNNRISVASDLRLTGTINPEYVHEAAGFRVDYFQDLDHFYEGLYLKVRAPIVWQNSGVRLNLSDSVSSNTVNAFGATGAGDTSQFSIADYFSGNLSVTDRIQTDAGQRPLTHARIDGPQSNAGLADIDVLVGVNFKESKSSHAGGHVGFTIPVASAPDGRFLGEDGLGNNGHWAVGIGFNTSMMLFESEKSSMRVNYASDWRYLFDEYETRTLGLKGVDWAQYFLVAKESSNYVFPLANLLTNKVRVYPGQQLDSKLELSYNYGGFTFDLGYNGFIKESEQVKHNFASVTDDRLYAFVAPSYNDDNFSSADRAEQFLHTIDSTNDTIEGTNPEITNNDIDVEPARTPSQVTHKVYTGLGYAFNGWDVPMMLGVGASYEGHTSQVGRDNWALWGKLGLTF